MTSRSYIFIAGGIVLTHLALNVLAQKPTQPAITAKETIIWTKPRRSSEQLTTLAQETILEVVKRQGGWYQVQLDNDKTGWVPLLSVRFQPEEPSTEQSISDILRQTAEMPTAAGITSGVRGMTNEDLESKENSSQDLDSIDQFIPTNEEMQEFHQEELNQTPKIEINDY